jgi:hypothetical protein
MLKKEFCVAASRLIYDIIGADGYVSDRELEIMERALNEKYGLNDPSRAVDVNKTTFSDALKTLQDWDEKKEVNDLINDLNLITGVNKYYSKDKKYTTVEGHCSLSEAWLLLAVEYALNGNATVFSIRKSDYRFARSEIIYMENSDENTSIYKEMSEHYKEYKARLELVGIRLVYIPKVCAYLKRKREQQKLKSLMRYVSPFHRYEDQDAQRIVDNIDKITTSEFAKDFFSQKANIYNSLKPSFLLKIGTSIIEEEKQRSDKDDKEIKHRRMSKSNFMLIPIEGSVGETLRNAFEKYQEYTLDLHIPERKLHEKLHDRPFRLHGFDRTFLNFVMSHVLNTEKLTKIVFDFSDVKDEGKQVRFIFEGRRTVCVPLGNKQMCLYLLVILFTTFGKGVPLEQRIRKKSGQIMDVEKVFNSIYYLIKGHLKKELYDGKGRLTNDISRVLGRLEDIPSNYHIKISNNKVIVDFPCIDIVYVKFNKKEKLLREEIERVWQSNCKMRFEDVCSLIFR